MKTLCFSLGLLLFVCHSDAMPHGATNIAGPEECCFDFSKKDLPEKRVTAIIRTHPRCLNKAFIVSTVAGKKICYKNNFKWAVDTFNKFNPEGSS